MTSGHEALSLGQCGRAKTSPSPTSRASCGSHSSTRCCKIDHDRQAARVARWWFAVQQGLHLARLGPAEAELPTGTSFLVVGRVGTSRDLIHPQRLTDRKVRLHFSRRVLAVGLSRLATKSGTTESGPGESPPFGRSGSHTSALPRPHDSPQWRTPAAPVQ